MNKLLLASLFTLLTIVSHAQKVKPDYTAIDKKALQIPAAQTKTTRDIADYVTANFTSASDKARAIFIWTASNIQYDIDNMFAINFYEKREEKINKALSTGKGICENYATVFNDICSKAGLTSYVIEGYTKQNGFTDYISHAWCAALIDTSWFLFDPTWGSGYISNQKFVKKINNDYFKVPPSVLIRSHMPFDPLWQFLYYPVSVQEYYEGKIQALNKVFFNYNDSIKTYNLQTQPEQLQSVARRIEQNGIRNSMIFDRLAHLKRELEIYKQNEQVNAQNETMGNYNAAVADFNDAVNDFNAFIDYRNKQFLPKKPDDAIKRMIEIPDEKIKSAKTRLNLIKHSDSNTAQLILSMSKSIDEIAGRIDEQKEFVTKYISKGAMGRKGMFTKYTWMGIPLN
ncbi:MAG: hypothetical protein JWQ38_3285 [Flavipsychrobacter sp.]|nr:hypothetical protein [Flavipsychrobacter sp.]